MRAIALALVALVVSASIALADQVQADTDTATAGNQSDNDVTLSTTPGGVVSFPVDLYVECQSNAHMGSEVSLTYSSANSTIPVGGALSATTANITRPDEWPADGSNCGNPKPAAPKGTSTVTATAPNAIGSYAYVINWVSADQDISAPPGQVRVNLTLNVAAPVVTDTTPPVITYVISGTAGLNDWYTSNVTVTWSVNDADSAITSTTGCGVQSFTAETTGVLSSCSATSAGGTSNESVTIKIDKTGPTGVALSPSGTLGSNGWYTSDVNVTTSGTETISGPASCTALQSFTAETAGTTVTGSCTNQAGLTTNADSISVKIDKSAPSLNVSGAASIANLDICVAALPSRPSFAPSDDMSGVASSSDSWSTPSTASGVGTYSYNATATNGAGLVASETRTYVANYGSAFSGVLQPINADGTSRFKLGSTVPVKFRLVCGTTPIDNAVARLTVAQGDTRPDPGTDEAISTAASTTGNLFRYDASAGQYIFNLSTKQGYTNPGGTTITQFAQGTWTLGINLDDGSSYAYKIQLVK